MNKEEREAMQATLTAMTYQGTMGPTRRARRTGAISKLQDAMCKKVWQDAAQRCHEMYMEQEYQDKIDYCHDDYAGGIAEGMARCAKELAKKAKEQQ